MFTHFEHCDTGPLRAHGGKQKRSKHDFLEILEKLIEKSVLLFWVKRCVYTVSAKLVVHNISYGVEMSQMRVLFLFSALPQFSARQNSGSAQ